jgi:hypothetical protein
MIGALVLSDKPVVVNSGSLEEVITIVTGTFPMGTEGDIGFDQIVPLGKKYIFVRGNVTDELERALVSHSDNTNIYQWKSTFHCNN